MIRLWNISLEIGLSPIVIIIAVPIVESLAISPFLLMPMLVLKRGRTLSALIQTINAMSLTFTFTMAFRNFAIQSTAFLSAVSDTLLVALWSLYFSIVARQLSRIQSVNMVIVTRMLKHSSDQLLIHDSDPGDGGLVRLTTLTPSHRDFKDDFGTVSMSTLIAKDWLFWLPWK